MVNGLNDVGSASIANLVQENVLPRFNADDISKGYNMFDTRLASGWYVDSPGDKKKKKYKTNSVTFKISK